MSETAAPDSASERATTLVARFTGVTVSIEEVRTELNRRLLAMAQLPVLARVSASVEAFRQVALKNGKSVQVPGPLGPEVAEVDSTVDPPEILAARLADIIETIDHARAELVIELERAAEISALGQISVAVESFRQTAAIVDNTSPLHAAPLDSDQMDVYPSTEKVSTVPAGVEPRGGIVNGDSGPPPFADGAVADVTAETGAPEVVTAGNVAAEHVAGVETGAADSAPAEPPSGAELLCLVVTVGEQRYAIAKQSVRTVVSWTPDEGDTVLAGDLRLPLLTLPGQDNRPVPNPSPVVIVDASGHLHAFRVDRMIGWRQLPQSSTARPGPSADTDIAGFFTVDPVTLAGEPTPD
jgi:hypothetical protein